MNTAVAMPVVDGWDDDRIRITPGLPDPARCVDELAHRLAIPSTEALVQHAPDRACTPVVVGVTPFR